MKYEVIILFVLSIASAATGAIMDGWAYKKSKTNGKESLKYNKLWHRIKPVNIVLYMVVGSYLTIHSGLFQNGWIKTSTIIFSDAILFTSVYWIVFDYVYYKAVNANVPFLEVSEWAKSGNNGIISDIIATPVIKIILFIIAAVQNYLIT